MGKYLFKVNISKKNPYGGDLLDRANSGNILLQLIKSFPGGFVLAINGKWGSGKTTFVEMWQQQMITEGYQALYYNAWEMDHIADPLIGIVGEFKKMTKDVGMNQVEKFTNVFRKISFSMIPSLLAFAAKTYTGLDLKDVIKDGSKKAIDLLNECVDDYIKDQESIKAFRDEFAESVREISSDKPIIFIIDELDRCKPDFAVKTIERIKHLFSDANVVFVLAIDRVQLGNSIKGYYGSDLIDADDYLRRFIDVQYDLPNGTVRTVENLLEVIFKQFGFDKIMIFDKKLVDSDSYGDLKSFVKSLYIEQDMSFRQLERWMLHTKLVLDYAINSGISLQTLSYLVYLQDFDVDFYKLLMNSNISDQDIFDHLIDFFTYSAKKGVSREKDSFLVIGELFRLKYYNDDVLYQQRIIDKNGHFKLNVNKNITIALLRKVLMDTSKKRYKSLSTIAKYLSELTPIVN